MGSVGIVPSVSPESGADGHSGSNPDESTTLWEAVTKAAPEVAERALAHGTNPPARWVEYPGFEDWLLVEFALGTPTRSIAKKLKQIREDQLEDGIMAWPPVNKRQLDWHRNHKRLAWEAIRSRVSERIETVGVLAKNHRLLVLERLAEELLGKVEFERDNSNKLYLYSEVRAVLRQIAEEKGELGEPGEATDNKLMEIALILAETVKVQGQGVVVEALPAESAYYRDVKDDDGQA